MGQIGLTMGSVCAISNIYILSQLTTLYIYIYVCVYLQTYGVPTGVFFQIKDNDTGVVEAWLP